MIYNTNIQISLSRENLINLVFFSLFKDVFLLFSFSPSTQKKIKITQTSAYPENYGSNIYVRLPYIKNTKYKVYIQ